jgi:hypothetical protein
MRNRSTHLSKGCYTSDAGELRLCGMQRLLRFPRCRDVHQCTNKFLFARFVFRAMGPDSQVFHRSIRHQKTVLVVVVWFATCRTINLVQYQFPVIRVNTLEDEVERRRDRFVHAKYPICLLRPDNVAARYVPAKAARMT